MKAGFSNWRQSSINIGMKRKLNQLSALHQIQRILERYEPRATAFKKWRSFTQTLRKHEKGAKIIQNIKNRKLVKTFDTLKNYK